MDYQDLQSTSRVTRESLVLQEFKETMERREIKDLVVCKVSPERKEMLVYLAQWACQEYQVKWDLKVLQNCKSCRLI